MAIDIEFDASANVDPRELLAFYKRQQHGMDCSVEKVQRMIDQSFCLVTARQQGDLIGFARGVTDGVVGQLVECKLDPAFQGPGCVTRKDGRVEHDAQGVATEMARRVVSSLLGYGVERIETIAHETETDFCHSLGFHRTAGTIAMQCTAAEQREHEMMAADPAAQV